MNKGPDKQNLIRSSGKLTNAQMNMTMNTRLNTMNQNDYLLKGQMKQMGEQTQPLSNMNTLTTSTKVIPKKEFREGYYNPGIKSQAQLQNADYSSIFSQNTQSHKQMKFDKTMNLQATTMQKPPSGNQASHANQRSS